MRYVLAGVIVAAALATTAVWWRAEIGVALQARLAIAAVYQAQQACLSGLNAPAVTYAETVAQTPVPSDRPEGYGAGPAPDSSEDGGPQVVAIYNGAEPSVTRMQSAWVAPAWHRFQRAAGRAGLPFGKSSFTGVVATPFVGGLEDGAGRRRLVCVTVDKHAVRAFVIRPGTWLKAPTLLKTAVQLDVMRSRPDDVLRFFNGRVDPADPSRFTVAYEIGGRGNGRAGDPNYRRPGVLHGRLGSDGRVGFSGDGWLDADGPARADWRVGSADVELREVAPPRSLTATTSIQAVAFLDGHARLAAACTDRLDVWDVATGGRVSSWPLSEYPYWPEHERFTFSADGRFLCDSKFKAKTGPAWAVYRTNDGFVQLSQPELFTRTADFAGDPPRLFVNCVPGKVEARHVFTGWRLGTGEVPGSISDLSAAGGTVAVLARLTEGSERARHVLFRPAKRGDEWAGWQTEPDPQHSSPGRLAVSPDANRVASSGSYGPFDVYDAATGRLRHRVHVSQLQGNRPMWSPDGRCVAFT